MSQMSCSNQKPKLLLSTTTPNKCNVGFTLVLCFSRSWCVTRFFRRFEKMRVDVGNCNLVIFDNSNSSMLERLLREVYEGYKDGFRTVRLYKTYRSSGPEILTDDIGDFDHSKLPMIYAMQRDIMDLIHTDVFVLLEDDTLAPKNAVIKLLQTLKHHKKIGVVCAIETSRSIVPFAKVRLGVHYMKVEGHKIIERISLPSNFTGLRGVHGCGWYCIASHKKIWSDALNEMRPYIHEIPRWGLDNIHTYLIHRKGFRVVADFSLWCKHMQTTPEGIIEWGKKQSRPMLDIWIPSYGKYAESVILEWKHRFVPREFLKNR